ncbi:neurotrophin 1 [Trichonephila inaurata madagascariensis]|uniref:Neurotrophin 1 n=1 Tax=Trichonephila inaurata madagascariensis TaxID=2747483 RepID=A0A8X6IHQ1_9ARAC|nr:neurotrophin 1 [Trichonephila inaurata madagascariensis]
MSYTVFLLSLLLIGIVAAQSTTETPTSTTNGEFSTEKQSVEKDSNKTDAQDDDDPLKAAESMMDRFTFTEADAKTTPQQVLDDDNDLGENDEDLAEVAEELTLLLDDDLKLFNGTPVFNRNTSTEDVDDVSDEDGENDEISFENAKPIMDSQPEDLQIKRQGDLNPDFGLDSDFNQPKRDDTLQAPDTPLYLSASDQSLSSDSANDNSPLLQLTQGGYQRPYQRGNRFNSPRQRMRASQPSETVENPTRTTDNDEQTRQPQITSQVTYTEPYQQQLGFASGLGFRNPFLAPDSFVNGNGMMPQAVQNSFFNIPPAGFTDFSGVNFQAPFSPSNDGRFQSAPRNPGSIPLFNAPPTHMLQQNTAFTLQNPQYPQTQFLPNDPLQSTRGLYQTGSFTNFQGPDNINDASRPDYLAFFRSSSPNNMQFQLNQNPFVQNPSGNPMYNPLMNMQPNYPSFDDASPFSPRYPSNNGQIPVESTTQEQQKQQQDPDTLSTGEEAKDMVQINVSPDKEDRASVPFGARIQKQNDPEDQNNFAAQKDVYLRYPLTEAGYATEENLPDQNTTDKVETTNLAPPRPIFTFFQAPRQFRGYNSPDPYRNALNAIQQGFPAEDNTPNNDDNNRTRQDPPQQLFVQNAPYPFDQRRTPRPIFPGYSDGNQDASLLPIPPFYHVPDDDVSGDPFEKLTGFPDRNYQFSSNLPVGNQVQDANATPACAQENNSTLCFEDQDYPRREVLFALNSDPLLMDRLTLPDQQLDAISLVEQNVSESLDSQDNYICKSDIKYGLPLRAKDIKGQWKIIINVEKAMGGGRFMQPVRLEVCKGAGEPCNFTQTKTACVQKYSLQRLLSWSPEKGVHNDVYKLPIACSCQLVDAQA